MRKEGLLLARQPEIAASESSATTIANVIGFINPSDTFVHEMYYIKLLQSASEDGPIYGSPF